MDDAWTTKDGERIAWADLTDRHLLNIVRMLTRVVRMRRRCLGQSTHDASVSDWAWNAWRQVDHGFLQGEIPKLARAFAEVEARGLLPTREDLCIAWDRVCGGTGGPDLSEDPAKRPWCLVELWVGFRGESTVSAEYAARLAAESATVAP